MTVFLFVILSILSAANEPEITIFTDPLVTQADSIAKETDSGQVVVFDSTEVDVEENGRSHFTRHVMVKIYDSDAARSRQTLRMDYDPLANDNKVVSCTVHSPDSSRIVSVERFEDVEAPAQGIYWGGRMRLYSVGPVRPGDIVEYTTYKVGFQIAYLKDENDAKRFVPPQPGTFYDVVLFGEHRPVVHKSYTIRMPRDKPVQYREYNGEIANATRFDGDMLIYSWWKNRIPAIPHEPLSADLSDFVPKVVLATLEDWPSRARWFNETNEPVFALNDEIRRKTEEIIEGYTTDEEKFMALQQWVATHIRYSGLSMGEGEGYTIHPAEMIFSERSGVCKDIAGMLIAMLRAAGYETYPALTMAGARVEDIPADQFNHCVVAVSMDDGSFFMLDPTWCSYCRYPWSRWEGDQHYVVGSPQGEERSQHPLFIEDNRAEIQLDTRLSETGTLVGSFRMEPHGIYDTRLRRALIYRSNPEWDALFHSYLRGFGEGVEITRSMYSDPDDLFTPMWLEIEFEVFGYAVTDGSTLVFRDPLLVLFSNGYRFSTIVRYENYNEQETPAMIWATRWETGESTLRLPKDFRFNDADTLSLEYSENRVQVSMKRRTYGSKSRTTADSRILDRYLLPHEFASVLTAAEKIATPSNNLLVCSSARGK